jgi:hypothetical protein
MAGVESGSEARQPNRDKGLPDGSLTTTRDRRPLPMIVEREELEAMVVPPDGTSQTGPSVATALGRTVVPGGQPGGVA